MTVALNGKPGCKTPYQRMVNVWEFIGEQRRQSLCYLAQVPVMNASAHWSDIPIENAKRLLTEVRLLGVLCHMIHDDDAPQHRQSELSGTGTNG